MDILKVNEEDMEADLEPSAFANKSTADEIVEGTKKKYISKPPILLKIDALSPGLAAREKPVKKSRRSPNAFMLFANEQRRILDPSIIKEQKCHTNAVLGGMWRDLPNSEKAKYLNEARQLLKAHKKSEATLSRKTGIKEKKVRFKLPKATVDSLGRVKKKNLSKKTTNLQISETSEIKKSEIESNSNKPASDKIENIENISSSSESRYSVEYPFSPTSQQHSTTPQSHFHSMVASAESRPSKHCCCRVSDCSNNDSNSKQHSPITAGTPKSCFGAGFFPPMFPPYHFNMPFSMYPQPMAPPMVPFPSFGFPQSPYGFNSPYFYNSAYFNAYGSLYTGGVMGPVSYGSHPSGSATLTNFNTKEESATEATKKAENSEDELLVVDETSHDEERKQDKESS